MLVKNIINESQTATTRTHSGLRAVACIVLTIEGRDDE